MDEKDKEIAILKLQVAAYRDLVELETKFRDQLMARQKSNGFIWFLISMLLCVTNLIGWAL